MYVINARIALAVGRVQVGGCSEHPRVRGFPNILVIFRAAEQLTASQKRLCSSFELHSEGNQSTTQYCTLQTMKRQC